MAAYETGYKDELFEHPVGRSLHCCICTNVIKDPVACRFHEHLFCRTCITEHLKKYQICPSCMEPLTVDTLSQAPRTVTKLLAELKTRCKFFDRGCGEFIELANREAHLKECGFAPAVCSNKGCQFEVNKRDLLHHEMAVCEQRRCGSCKEIRQETDIVKVNLVAVNAKMDHSVGKLKRIEGKLDKSETTFENVVESVESVVAKVKLVQEQLKKQEESNRRLEADNVEIKKSLNEMTKQLKRIKEETSHGVQVEHKRMKKGFAGVTGRESIVVIVGGKNKSGSLNSVEMFSLSNRMWTPLQLMRERRSEASSVVYDDQFIVMGGLDTSKNNMKIKNMETLSVNACYTEQSLTWKNFPAELHKCLANPCSVLYNGRLIVIGGDGDDYESSRSIIEISLVPPYTSQLLATMQPFLTGYRHHSAVLFDDKIVIVGDCLERTVLMYNITENVFKHLAPLPYIVSYMAMIKWDENFVLLGGADKKCRPLSKVLMYNIESQKSYMLPEMKYKRSECVAAVVRDTVIVMGGQDEAGNYLKSVECFRFDSFTWEELPDMHEERCQATVVIS